jgi:hypothetical protein
MFASVVATRGTCAVWQRAYLNFSSALNRDTNVACSSGTSLRSTHNVTREFHGVYPVPRVVDAVTTVFRGNTPRVVQMSRHEKQP